MSTLSKLTGGDASHNAGIAQSNSTAQLAKQNQYAGLASGVYGNLNTQGKDQAGIYQGNYLQLLDKFAGVSGLGNPIDTQGWRAPDNPAANGQLAQGAGSALGAAAGTPQGQGGLTNPNDPYALDTYQQQQLNQTNANLANQQKSAIASYQQQMAAQGLTDPRDLQLGIESLNEHFSGLQAQAQTQFYEQVKQDKQKALQALIGEVAQYGTQGLGLQESAAQGYQGLASGALATASQQQQASQYLNNLSNDQLGGLLQLVGGGLGSLGGVGGGLPAGTSGAVGGGLATGAIGGAGSVLDAPGSVGTGLSSLAGLGGF